jgi:CheY-like chemotaxis protein
MTLKSLRESLSPYFAALNTGSPSVGATSVIQRTQIEDESMKMKILVAEDNIVNQKVVKKMLLSLRYIADFVTNGQEALNNMKKTTRETVYDVILMDLQMPRMDGIEATKNIRNEVSDGLQPAIMALTADVAQHVPPLCKKAGMNGYVCKPVQKESLKEALGEVSRWKVRGRDPGELKSRLRWIAISDSNIKVGKRSESIDEARNRPMLEEKTATPWGDHSKPSSPSVRRQ